MQSQPTSSVAPGVTPEIDAAEMEAIMAKIEGQNAVGVQAATTQKADPTNPIKSFFTAEELARHVGIDLNNLDSCYQDHAGWFVYYANIRSKARQQFEKMKAAFEVLEARLYAEIRLKLASDATKKPTEAAIDAAVKADPRWWAGKNRVIDAQGIYDLAQNSASAFEQRRDMLIQIGSDRRQERQGQVRTMEVKERQNEVLQALQKQSLTS